MKSISVQLNVEPTDDEIVERVKQLLNPKPELTCSYQSEGKCYFGAPSLFYWSSVDCIGYCKNKKCIVEEK
jgi:hypothetical protein